MGMDLVDTNEGAAHAASSKYQTNTITANEQHYDVFA
jgi:hypothetical protein